VGTLGRRRGAALAPGPRQTLVLAATLILPLVLMTGCSHTQTVRLQPNTVEAGAGLRPIAGIQTNAVSWYLLFVPIPGGVDLDRVVNRMLIVAAKTMGADKVAQLRFEATPNGGVWALRKLFLWRSASAHGIAVQVTEAPPDPGADEGPEPTPANDPPH
jgi:hypothetical protein